MSDLDEKLEKILTKCRKMEITEDEQVKALKTAFADEGWKDSAFIAANTSLGRPNEMTGQEWFDRFEEENKITPEDAIEMYSDNAYETLFAMSLHSLDAARRAAGLSPNKEKSE